MGRQLLCTPKRVCDCAKFQNRKKRYKGKLVIVFGEKPNDNSAKVIKELKIPCEVIGDAKSVHRIVDAVREGCMVAKEI